MHHRNERAVLITTLAVLAACSSETTARSVGDGSVGAAAGTGAAGAAGAGGSLSGPGGANSGGTKPVGGATAAGGRTAGGAPGAGGYEFCLICGGSLNGAGGFRAAGGAAGSIGVGGSIAAGGAATATCAQLGGMCQCAGGPCPAGMHASGAGCPQPCPTCGGCSESCCEPGEVDAGPLPCGTSKCSAHQVCVHGCSGTGGAPSAHCLDVPQQCGKTPTCSCLPSTVCSGSVCTNAGAPTDFYCQGCL